jgi:tetratricopeptide (TPR) repeat protein
MTDPNLQADDFYERLGVVRTASQTEIKKAYQTLLRQYPPERAPDEFKRIREAYEALGSPESRGEYDRALPPELQKLIQEATAASEAGNHADAERLMKQVLLQQPDLGYVRNELGLVLLHQDRAAEAVAQFERLTARPDAGSIWWTNLCHAYRLAQRGPDAISAAKKALTLPDADATRIHLAWAEVHIDANETGKALEVLEKGIQADGRTDFDDMELVLRVLDLRIGGGDEKAIGKAADRVASLATDDEQKRYTAWRIARIAISQVRSRNFGLAKVLSDRARTLQPQDTDYSALSLLADHLNANRHDQARTLLATSPTFRADGWLDGLTPDVGGFLDQNAALAGMQPIKNPPRLFTLNSIGTGFWGKRDEDPSSGSYITTLCFVVLFLPLIPLSAYRVIRDKDKRYSVLGKVPLSKMASRMRWGIPLGLLLWIFTAGASSSSNRDKLDNGEPKFETRERGTVSAGSSALPDEIAGVSRDMIALEYRGEVTVSGRDPIQVRLTIDSTVASTSGRIELSGGAEARATATVTRINNTVIATATDTGTATVYFTGTQRRSTMMNGSLRFFPLNGQGTSFIKNVELTSSR